MYTNDIIYNLNIQLVRTYYVNVLQQQKIRQYPQKSK